MTCAKEEDQFLLFQRRREDKMITEKVDKKEKELQKNSKKVTQEGAGSRDKETENSAGEIV